MSIVTCPKCEMRVIAGSEGHCPSCGAILSAAAYESASQDETEPDIAVSPLQQRSQEIPTHFDLLAVCFSFRGRIPRSIFWIPLLLGYVMLDLSTLVVVNLLSDQPPAIAGVTLVYFIFGVWIYAAVTVKRLHDLSWPGWPVVFALIPGISWIISFLVTGALPGTRGPNRFGPDPRDILNR